MNKNNNLTFWNNTSYPIDSNSLLTNALITKFINKLWDDQRFSEKLNENNHLMILFRVKFDNNQISTIGHMQRISYKDKVFYCDHIKDLLTLKNENYTTEPILNIIFSYKIKNGHIEPRTINTSVPTQNHYNNKLPLCYNPNDYGKIILQTSNKYVIAVNKNVNVIIEKCKDELDREFNYVKYLKNNSVLYDWNDYYINDFTFERHLGKSIYRIENGEIVLRKVIKSTNTIKPIQIEDKINSKIITMDLETIVINNEHKPYLLCWYDGEIVKSYYITDYDNDFNKLIKATMFALENIEIIKSISTISVNLMVSFYYQHYLK